MTSPYLTHEANRLGIAREAVNLAKTIRPASTYIASQAEYNWRDYHFLRAPSDGIAPEKTKPITSVSRLVWRPLAICAGGSATLYLLQLIAEWAQANGVHACTIFSTC